MNTVISQTVVLPSPADALFHMYLDPTEHSAITGTPASIGAKPGAVFSAFAGALNPRRPTGAYGGALGYRNDSEAQGQTDLGARDERWN